MFLRRKQGESQPLAPDHDLPNPDSRRQKIYDNISYLKKQISYSKCWMAVFFMISLGAAVDFRFFPPISEKTRDLLGAPPPPTLISVALIVYAFSALILILGHLNKGTVRFQGWSHMGYLSAFYIFFYYAGLLRENFWPVFISGLTILGLEHYRVWSVCSETIREEKKILKILEK